MSQSDVEQPPRDRLSQIEDSSLPDTRAGNAGKGISSLAQPGMASKGIDHTAFINELVKSYATGQRPNLQSAQRALSGGLPASQQQPAVSRHDSAPAPLPQTSSQSQSSSPKARTRDEEPNKKRKRNYTDEEWREWRVNIPLKVEAERRRIEDEISQRADANKEIQALFNELQGLAADFGEGFNVPEFVVAGMQSDGKSTFIEGLLGFQFNIVETGIGTRRPLIIQMINNPEKLEPACRFRRDDASPSAPEEDAWDQFDTPARHLCEEIMQRTNVVAGHTKNKVSSKPIILRVEYKDCANLTIYDTPGFRSTGDEGLLHNIDNMVMELAKEKHRIIICLEQSTTEWSNTQSRPLIRRVDPDFSRTVLVNTKFDNRVKELRDDASAEDYLRGENLPPGKQAFFISMPVRRNLDSRTFLEAVKTSYLEDYRSLLEVRIDEKRFMPQIGFFRVKSHLEELLHKKYRECAAPTLQLLNQMVQQLQQETETLDRELRSADMEKQKSKALEFVDLTLGIMDKLLQGSVIGDPDTWGQTLEEERTSSGVAAWPHCHVQNNFQVPNAEYKIYGGSQYERLLSEFELVAQWMELPATSMNEVASAMGTSKAHNVPVFAAAASDIVLTKARRFLQPLIRTVMSRAAYILKKLMPVAIVVMLQDEQYGLLGQCQGFLLHLQKSYDAFIEQLKTRAESIMTDEFMAFTKKFDWGILSGFDSVCQEYNYLERNDQASIDRAQAMVLSNPVPTFPDPTPARRLDSETTTRVLMCAGKLWSVVRFIFAKNMRIKLNAFFMEPVFEKLHATLMEHFQSLSHQEYDQMFLKGVEQLQERQQHVTAKLEKIKRSRDHFEEATRRMSGL